MHALGYLDSTFASSGQTHLYVYKGLDGRSQKKTVFVVRDEASYLSEVLGFSLPSLLENPVMNCSL